MNKKFSTLLAGFLLAGAFGTASADTFETAASTGGYYKLIRTEQYQNGSSGSWTDLRSSMTNKMYLTLSDNGLEVVESEDLGDAALWKITKHTLGTNTYYSFVNKLGKTLTYKQEGQPDQTLFLRHELAATASNGYNGDAIWQNDNIYLYMDYAAGSPNKGKAGFANYTVASTESGITRFSLAFDAVACGDEEMTVDELNAKGTGSAFQLSVKKDAKLEKDLAVEANPLTTKTIVAVKDADNKIYFKVSGDFKNGDATTTDAFKKSEFIVADTIAYSNLNTSTVIGDDGAGYQYIVVKGSSMVGATATRNLVNAQFVVTKNANDAHVKIKNPDAKFPLTGTGLSNHTAPTNDPYATVYNFNGKNYIGTGNAADTYLTFGAGSSADLTALAGQIVTVDFVGTGGNDNIGKVLATKADGEDIGWVKAAYVDQTKPEGRFYVKVDNSKNLVFVNLENAKEYAFNGTIYDKGNNVYANGTDTLKLTAVTRAAQTEGYLNFDKDALADKVFTASLYTKALGNGYWVAPVQSTGVVTFSSAAADATEWSLVKAQKASSDDYAYSDSIIVKLDYNVWNAKDKKYEAKSDSTVSFAYAIKESVSGNYLAWDAAKNAYKLSTTPNYFVFKEKDGHVVIIPATKGGAAAAEWNNDKIKLIGAASSNNLAQVKTIYSVVENDLFDITEINAMRYRNLGELALDTVKVFRADNEKVILFEKNESTVIKDSINFLGIEHIADVEGMKAGLFVDTAYVSNTVVPKYMFAVGSPVITYKKEACSDPTHPIHETDQIESITGRYLVNLADSAAAYADYRNNPYIHKYEGANCPRLGFVDATHAGNKLIIADTKKEIDLSKDEFQYSTFALRYVDREAGSFKLQTKGGYVKYMNGVVAVTGEANADVFNLAKTSEEPTANDAISAEAGVQVIGGQGVVTVQGAAGKVITVANILGQTIANQVAASDNVTIAAPAGVVVVAVDGDATKVVVK